MWEIRGVTKCMHVGFVKLKSKKSINYIVRMSKLWCFEPQTYNFIRSEMHAYFVLTNDLEKSFGVESR